MRFFLGVVAGAVGAGLAHHGHHSTTVVYLVGASFAIAVWCRIADALWELLRGTY